MCSSFSFKILPRLCPNFSISLHFKEMKTKVKSNLMLSAFPLFRTEVQQWYSFKRYWPLSNWLSLQQKNLIHCLHVWSLCSNFHLLSVTAVVFGFPWPTFVGKGPTTVFGGISWDKTCRSPIASFYSPLPLLVQDFDRFSIIFIHTANLIPGRQKLWNLNWRFKCIQLYNQVRNVKNIETILHLNIDQHNGTKSKSPFL